MSQLQVEMTEIFSNEMLAYLRYTNTATEANLAFKITTSNDLFTFWIVDFPAIYKTLTDIDFTDEVSKHLPAKLKEEMIKANSDVTNTFVVRFFFEQKSLL